MEAYLKGGELGKDKMTEFPDEMQKAFEAHLQLYLTDPEKAHIFDPAPLGIQAPPGKCMLLTHTGRKTGRRLNAIIQYFERDGKFIIVASKGGNAQDPDWYKNLVANPQCEIRMGKFATPAIARTVTKEERAELWPSIIAEQPEIARYELRTTLIIPIVIFDLP
jgi:proline iminopeptidase